MAQLDRLLSVMISNRAEALMLNEGDLGKLEMHSGARPVTKAALTAAQVVGLLKEIAPSDAARHIDDARPASFSYLSTDGSFVVKATLDDGKWRVRIAVDADGELHRVGNPSNGSIKIPGLETATPARQAPAVAAPAPVPQPVTTKPTTTKPTPAKGTPTQPIALATPAFSGTPA